MPRRACLVLTAAAALVISGCGEKETEFVANFKYPRRRLERKAEKELMKVLEDIGKGYLVRVKAEEVLRGKLKEKPAERPGIVRYLVPLLDDATLDVRASVLKLILEYGRDCPEAVVALVGMLGKLDIKATSRDGAARILVLWSREDLGYNAWGPESEVKAGAERWKSWLERTGGALPPGR